MSVPVISVAQMRQWEKSSWAAGKSETEVIAQVGHALAQRLLLLTDSGATILMLVGRGHNGDDARAAEQHLFKRQVTVLSVTAPDAAVDDLRRHIQVLQQLRVSGKDPWIVDALFGIGLNRPLDQQWKHFIDVVNESGLPVLAVDVPSGLNAETGNPEGNSIRATVTLTVGAPKKGLLAPHASSYVGRLEVLPEVGLIPCPATAIENWTLPEDFVAFPPDRAAQTNKGTYGHLAIWAGSLGYHGAAILAARGAMRAQPGLITVFPQEAVYLPVAAQLQAPMVRPWKSDCSLPKGCTAILAGPGLAAENLPECLKSNIRDLWQKSPIAMVCDASALDWLPKAPIESPALRVITPHPGEAARLLATSTQTVQADRLAALRELSRLFGNCYVVLKGHQTLIGRNEGEVCVNGSGNPFLAQGGSGDVLGGFLAGLLTQPALQKQPLKTIRYAVWTHGLTADRLTRAQRNWTVEDLAGVLGKNGS